MTSRTHIMCANALSLLITKPTSINGFVSTVAIATGAAILSDLDLANTEAHKRFDFLFFAVSCLILITLLLDQYTNTNLVGYFINNYSHDLFIYALIFLMICFYGMHKSHRSFMHSLLGMGLLSLSMLLISSHYLLPFLIGYGSHIILDLFNKKGLQLFYPIKKRYSFKMCTADGRTNNILFSFFSLIFILELIFLY